MADPELQRKLLESEKLYRPEYNKLELDDINTLLRGIGEGEDYVPGLLDQEQYAARKLQQSQAELNSMQRRADLTDVERLGARASRAFLDANPELKESLMQAEGLRESPMSVDAEIRNLMAQGVPQSQAAQIARSRLGDQLNQAGLDQLRGTAAEDRLMRAGMDQFRSSDEEALLGQAAMGQLQRGAGEMQLGQAAMGQFQRGAGEMQLGQAGMGQLQQAGMGEMQLNKRGMDFINRGGNLSPTQLRNVIQQSRVASQARGRVGDQSGIANETAARLAEEMNLERQNVDFGSQLLGQGFDMGQQRLNTGAKFVGQEFDMGQQRLNTGAKFVGQEFDMGQKRTGTMADLLSERFSMGQQRLGTGAQLLGREFDMGQKRVDTAGSIYDRDLRRDQSNAEMRQKSDLANLEASMTSRGLDLQALLGLGQLGQTRTQGDRGFALDLVNARQRTASDPFAAILGRESGAGDRGAATTRFTTNTAGQQLGPNLFDPNAGINLALQNLSNKSNYDSNIYGSQAALAGAKAQARASIIGSFLQCWVAREVYGNDNPMWLLFRQWLMEDSPDTFRKLYIKYGERFAKFISNKPFVKTIIRNWMTSKVKQKFFANSN
jgi:hypothetical protein